MQSFRPVRLLLSMSMLFLIGLALVGLHQGPTALYAAEPANNLAPQLYLPLVSGAANGTRPGQNPPTATPTATGTAQATATPTVTPTAPSTATPTATPTASPTASPTALPGDNVPAEVVGTWFEGQLLPLEFYDPNTGVWDSPSGLGQMYSFSAGTYTYAGFARTQYGQCTGEVSVYQQGVARSEGANLLLTPNLNKTRTVTICGSREESVVEGSHETRSVPWSLGHDQFGHVQLTLTDNDITRAYNKEGLEPALVGAWRKGPVSSTDFYDPATQTFVTPAGDGQWLRIEANGTFTAGEYGHAVDPQTGCELTGWLYQTGEVAVSGSRLTITPTSGMARYENACTPDAPRQEPWHDSAKSYTWLFRDYPNDPKLVIIPLEVFQEIEFVRE
jgi:hypothetical protein